LPPRWSLGYLGSTMSYTEAPDAQAQLRRFVELCDEHQIPCDLFHLSSGYTLDENGKRNVFTWDRESNSRSESDGGSFCARRHQVGAQHQTRACC
jgi:alpha-glucosidase (family GH31 glycosyl hydrolase)